LLVQDYETQFEGVPVPRRFESWEALAEAIRHFWDSTERSFSIMRAVALQMRSWFPHRSDKGQSGLPLSCSNAKYIPA